MKSKIVFASLVVGLLALSGCSVESTSQDKISQLEAEVVSLKETNNEMKSTIEEYEMGISEFSSAILNGNVFMKALSQSNEEKLKQLSNMLFIINENSLKVTRPTINPIVIKDNVKVSMDDWSLYSYEYSHKQPHTFRFHYNVIYKDAKNKQVDEDTRIILKIQKIDDEWKVVDIEN